MARGASYPHEAPEGGYSRQEYETYFWTDDVFVVVGHRDPATLKCSSEFSISTVGVRVDEARGGRAWEECLVGFFYIKPNYPGRSSHICNGGIVFSSHHRGGGYGRVAGMSYLYYAPRLGYKASIFNLVYATNEASLRTWDSLGFERVGCIPRAGRLQQANGEEAWVDAIIFYYDFFPPQTVRAIL